MIGNKWYNGNTVISTKHRDILRRTWLFFYDHDPRFDRYLENGWFVRWERKPGHPYQDFYRTKEGHQELWKKTKKKDRGVLL